MINVEIYPDDNVTRILENGKGVQVIHIPSGLCATCDIYKTLFKNKREACLAIREKLKQTA
jgi:protein subunit release factor A